MLQDTGERLILNDNWDLKTKMEHIHRYTAVSQLVKGKKVLDAACGTGYGTEILSRNADSAVGIDLSSDAVEFAASKFKKSNLVYRQMSVAELDFPDKSFDVVVSFETIEHITKENQLRFLAEVSRVLKDNGTLFISTPNDELERKLTFGAYTNPYHICEFNEAEFEGFLKQYFKNVKLYYQAVTSASIMVAKGKDQSRGGIITNGLDSDTERFYIAVCSNGEFPLISSLDSVFKPYMQDYYDEQYYLRRASLYIDVGNGFDGSVFSHAKCTSRDGKHFSYHFDLSNIENIKAIRFDPMEHAGIFKITGISANVSGISIRPANADSSINGVDTFTTMDPIYILTGDNVSEIDTLDIEGEILHEIPDYIAWNIKESQLRETIEQLNQNEIRIRESELNEIKNTLVSQNASIAGLTQMTHTQTQESAEINAVLRGHIQEAGAIVSILHEHQQECADLRDLLQRQLNESLDLNFMMQKQLRDNADLNFMLQKQLRDTDDIIFMSKNMQHSAEDIIFMSKNIQRSTNDMLYVMQQTGWYRRAIRRIERPSIPYRILHSMRNDGITVFLKKFVKKLVKKVYNIGKNNKYVKIPLKAVRRVVKWLFPQWGIAINKIIAESRMVSNQEVVSNGAALLENPNIWSGELPRVFAEKPLVSVIVPNYNHALYLRDRLESVYNQTYPNFEVILLDDCSTDDSRSILMEYAEKYPDKTIVDFNETNGGKVFKQWNKGINHAKGELIWIAESDDWCDLDFLEKMVPQFEYQSVMLAFCRSVFMQDGEQVWTLEEYLSDIPELNFDQSFMVSAHNAVRTAFGIKNIVPNVSSAMFRNVGQIPKEITDIWQNIKLCGDWLFYLHTIKGGTISYTNETTNYYRVHKNSTSLKIQKTPEYYQEQEQLSKYIVKNFDVDLKIFEKVLYNLEQHYQAINETADVSVVHENYKIERIAAVAHERRPSVLMCGFSLQIGGGETYPIVLANEMKKQGINVTFLDFNMDSYSEQVRGMIDRNIPVITLESPDYLGKILYHTGADVVHSHHASVDTMISLWLRSMDTKCRQIVTLHGMYETMNKEDCLSSFETLHNTCKKFIYIADKNLTRLNELGYTKHFDLVKIGNGLPQMDVTPVDRKSLGIEEDAFVFCIVSRALPQKGWQEASDAVIAANKTSKRKIHLILVGDGEMREKLSSLKSRYIHLVGQRSNVRDYFAASDMGLLPSTYKGESFPLVVIECMLTGKPVLASNLGEVKHQLTDENGETAGMLIELNNWKLNVKELSEMMVQVANDDALYQQLRSRVSSASEKFDITKIVKQHLGIYTNI